MSYFKRIMHLLAVGLIALNRSAKINDWPVGIPALIAIAVYAIVKKHLG